MKKSRKEIEHCAWWLAYCLKIGFINKSQINALEKLYWKYRPNHPLI